MVLQQKMRQVDGEEDGECFLTTSVDLADLVVCMHRSELSMQPLSARWVRCVSLSVVHVSFGFHFILLHE